MATFNINVGVNALKEKSKELEGIATTLKEDMNKVINNVHNVNKSWIYSNSDEYVKVFDEFKPKMDNGVKAEERFKSFYEQLSKFSEFLNIENIENAESDSVQALVLEVTNK